MIKDINNLEIYHGSKYTCIMQKNYLFEIYFTIYVQNAIDLNGSIHWFNQDKEHIKLC